VLSFSYRLLTFWFLHMHRQLNPLLEPLPIRPHHTMGETLSLKEQRQLFCEKLAALQLLMLMASEFNE